MARKGYIAVADAARSNALHDAIAAHGWPGPQHAGPQHCWQFFRDNPSSDFVWSNQANPMTPPTIKSKRKQRLYRLHYELLIRVDFKSCIQSTPSKSSSFDPHSGPMYFSIAFMERLNLESNKMAPCTSKLPLRIDITLKAPKWQGNVGQAILDIPDGCPNHT